MNWALSFFSTLLHGKKLFFAVYVIVLLVLFVLLATAPRTPTPLSIPAFYSAYDLHHPLAGARSMSSAVMGLNSVLQGAVPQNPIVRVVYFYPQGYTPDQRYIQAINPFMTRVQEWYREKVGSGKSFTFTVQPLQGKRPASYYGDGWNQSQWYQNWSRILEDIGGQLQGRTIDCNQETLWFIVTARTIGNNNGSGCGGGYAGGNMNGFAAITEWTFDPEIIGKTTGNCPPIPQLNYQGGPYGKDGCKENPAYGAAIHEFGHALTLPHPKDCDTTGPSYCGETVMWGWWGWPNIGLLDSSIAPEKTTLKNHAWFWSTTSGASTEPPLPIITPSPTPNVTPTSNPTPTQPYFPKITPTPTIITLNMSPTPTQISLSPTPIITPTPIPPSVTPTPTLSLPFLVKISVSIPSIKPPQKVLHPIRTLDMFLLDERGVITQKVSGSVMYKDGLYSGVISGTIHTPIIFSLQISMNNTLKTTIPLKKIQLAEIRELPTVKVFEGDVNRDNKLNILDYNIFLKCFGARLCPQKELVDVNDDGLVDEIDLNALLRNFAFLLDADQNPGE